MRRLLLLFTVALVMAALMVFSALPALAQIIPPHEHFLTTPAGTHEVAGGVGCAAHQPGFTNFHQKVHTGQPGQEAFAQENNPVSISASTAGC